MTDRIVRRLASGRPARMPAQPAVDSPPKTVRLPRAKSWPRSLSLAENRSCRTHRQRLWPIRINLLEQRSTQTAPAADNSRRAGAKRRFQQMLATAYPEKNADAARRPLSQARPSRLKNRARKSKIGERRNRGALKRGGLAFALPCHRIHPERLLVSMRHNGMGDSLAPA